jgi:hypothetical protein
VKAAKNLAKQRALHKEKVIKKRIEMLLTSATIGLVAGVIIGIVLPIGGVKKSEYKLLQQSNEKIQEDLKKANEEVASLKSKIEESSVYTSLSDEQREQVISYIGEIKGETNNDVSSIETTEIFKTLYKGYAYSVGYISLEDFKSIVDTFEFTYDVVDENKFIFKDSESSDVVTLAFSKTDDNNDFILNSVLYKREDKHIEAKNNNSIIDYKTYDGTEKTVNNINDQIKFLFS